MRALTTLKIEGCSGSALRQAIAATRRGGIVSVPGLDAGFIHAFLFGDAFEKGLTFKTGRTHEGRGPPQGGAEARASGGRRNIHGQPGGSVMAMATITPKPQEPREPQEPQEPQEPHSDAQNPVPAPPPASTPPPAEPVLPDMPPEVSVPAPPGVPPIRQPVLPGAA